MPATVRGSLDVGDRSTLACCAYHTGAQSTMGALGHELQPSSGSLRYLSESIMSLG